MATSNRQIAKNTAFLYVRKFITILIGLYASRMLLRQLGIEDYGLYGLAGSVVVMFSSLQALFTDSIQRFINVAKGRGEVEKVRKIFSYGVALNAVISVLFLIIVEIGALILFPRLNIPPGSVATAYWILQFSILSTITQIMTTPFDAVMIANERFNAYAGFSILSSVLNLTAILLLSYLPGRAVVTYAICVFVVAIIVRICSATYCKRAFGDEISYKLVWDKDLLKKMTFFSGWNFFGNIGYSIYDEGINFLLNYFGGLAVNGARTISVQIRAMIAQFNMEALSGFRPQIMSSYSREEFDRYYTLVFMGSKFSFSISAILSFVIAVFAPQVLSLWLGEIPDYTIAFIRCIMFYLVIRGIHVAIDIIFKTTARLKAYQLWEMSVAVSTLPLAWLGLQAGWPFYSVFLVASGCEIIKLAGDFVILRRHVGFPVGRYVRQVIRPCLTAAVILVAIAVGGIHLTAALPVGSLFYAGIPCGLLGVAVCFLLVFSTDERRSLFSMIRRK